MAGCLVMCLAQACLAGGYPDRATGADRRAFQEGLAAAQKMQPEIFPDGIGHIDALLYDAKDLYIYSQNEGYPLPKYGRWKKYTIYRAPHGGLVSERYMAICIGGIEFMPKEIQAVIAEQYFACAPAGSFQSIQRQRGSIYQYREGYLASIIHEYGHQYMEQEPEVLAIVHKMMPLVDAVTEAVSKDSLISETFANWCELQGARRLFPKQYQRMLDTAEEDRKDDRYGHLNGLKIAVKLLDDDAP